MFVIDSHPRNQRAELGRRGETLASDHLKRLGFATIARNVRTRRGEIDLIAFDGRTLVFAEVKTRHVRRSTAHPRMRQQMASDLGWPAAKQRRRLRGLALAWLSDRTRPRPIASELRFDILKVLVDDDERTARIEHLEGAG